MTPAANPLDELLTSLAGFTHDPLGYVEFAFPWGTGELRGHRLASWQRDVHLEIGSQLRADPHKPIRISVASGKGIGKSALVSQVSKWAMATHEDCRGVVTANTENQLRTKTWPELSKWHRLSIDSLLFQMTASRMYSRDPEHAENWRFDLIPWSETNPEAFAGLHNLGKRLLVVFDEASAIHDKIWETADFALTDAGTEIIWLAFGNPTRPTGRFRECFAGGKFSSRWVSRQIDSRSVEIVNRDELNEDVLIHGVDSDYVRVNILGQFPRTELTSFISRSVVEEAQAREVSIHPAEPVLLGVDVARFGEDYSVLYPRKGRDARSLPRKRFQGIDTMALADEVAAFSAELGADAIFVDEGGVGGGVVDRLRQMGLPIIAVNFGGRAAPVEGERFLNKRAEMWGRMRLALPGLALPADPALLDQLCGVQYQVTEGSSLIQLESKAAMKRRGMPSPDDADALALTYAFPVYLRNAQTPSGPVGADFNPFEAAA